MSILITSHLAHCIRQYSYLPPSTLYTSILIPVTSHIVYVNTHTSSLPHCICHTPTYHIFYMSILIPPPTTLYMAILIPTTLYMSILIPTPTTYYICQYTYPHLLSMSIHIPPPTYFLCQYIYPHLPTFYVNIHSPTYHICLMGRCEATTPSSLSLTSCPRQTAQLITGVCAHDRCVL